MGEGLARLCPAQDDHMQRLSSKLMGGMAASAKGRQRAAGGVMTTPMRRTADSAKEVQGFGAVRKRTACVFALPPGTAAFKHKQTPDRLQGLGVAEQCLLVLCCVMKLHFKHHHPQAGTTPPKTHKHTLPGADR